jgi:hypothetical protein
MKKITILLILTIIFTTTAIFANSNNVILENNVTSTIGGSFKILNDTDGDVQIHTGSGFVELNKGASTSITCEAGREIRSANKGKKGDVIFTVDDSMCGKTVKLSKYL